MQTTVVHNTAQNSYDNPPPSYTPSWSGVVYWNGRTICI